MFLISDALAADAAAGGASAALMQFLPLILIIVVFWLFLIRPQQKRAKEHQKMVEGLNKGDEVMTAGGIMGKVADLDEQNVKIQISTVEGTPVTIVMARQTIANVLPKGTVKFCVAGFAQDRFIEEAFPGFLRQALLTLDTAPERVCIILYARLIRPGFG